MSWSRRRRGHDPRRRVAGAARSVEETDAPRARKAKTEPLEARAVTPPCLGGASAVPVVSFGMRPAWQRLTAARLPVGPPRTVDRSQGRQPSKGRLLEFRRRHRIHTHVCVTNAAQLGGSTTSCWTKTPIGRSTNGVVSRARDHAELHCGVAVGRAWAAARCAGDLRWRGRWWGNFRGTAGWLWPNVSTIIDRVCSIPRANPK